MHPFHHALSSVKKFGGVTADYIAIHEWFDETKQYMGDCRHRALRHHTAGIFWCEQKFGDTITVWTKDVAKQVPIRLIAEQHVMEDMGFLPTPEWWLRNMTMTAEMNRVPTKSGSLWNEAPSPLTEEQQEIKRKLAAEFYKTSG
jgi:hypothetical protein